LKISDLTKTEIQHLLAGDGIRLKIGCFTVAVSSNITDLAYHLASLYIDFELLVDDEFVDYHVVLKSPSFLRSIIRQQVVFSFDGYLPFAPLPISQATAMFEWGVNWCIANSAQHFFIIHAAVIEKNGSAFIMPGQSGAGKSTLCAALVCSGWRLLSDELALISLNDELLYPLSRPVSLKNQSINIIQAHFPTAFISSAIKDTAKGDIAHMRPPVESANKSDNPAKPAGIIFPQYKADSVIQLTKLSRGEAFFESRSK
jgi:HprK-related kinase A